MNTDSKAEMLPCPFCGAGITSIRENGKMWTGQRYSEPTSVSVMHHCEPVDGQPSRAIERVGRDMERAIAAWNRRAPAELVPQWGKVGTCEWHDGYADHTDGGGPYKERVLYTAPQPPEVEKAKPVDAVLQLVIAEKAKKDALIAKGICQTCEGKGECGGQFTGGEWTCEDCHGTGRAHGICGKDT